MSSSEIWISHYQRNGDLDQTCTIIGAGTNPEMLKSDLEETIGLGQLNWELVSMGNVWSTRTDVYNLTVKKVPVVGSLESGYDLSAIEQ